MSRALNPTRERLAPEPGTKLGVALSTLGLLPINGLRHLPSEGTNGWYLWCGESLGDADDFFASLHMEHLSDHLPQVLEYLDLPPGYRFQIDGQGYEDVWFDAQLLESR